jgi:hypothetical protein
MGKLVADVPSGLSFDSTLPPLYELIFWRKMSGSNLIEFTALENLDNNVHISGA